MVGGGKVAGRGGLPLSTPEPLPVVSVAGAMGAAAGPGPVGAGSLPTRKRGFKRRAGGWDSSLIP
jgi:hypothetical protein